MVWLAVAMQIAAGGLAAAEPVTPLAALEAATIFCQGHTPAKDQAPRHHQRAEPALVQTSLSALQSLALIGASPCLASPQSGRLGRSVLPAARAPPGRAAAGFYARGPPAFT